MCVGRRMSYTCDTSTYASAYSVCHGFPNSSPILAGDHQEIMASSLLTTIATIPNTPVGAPSEHLSYTSRPTLVDTVHSAYIASIACLNIGPLTLNTQPLRHRGPLPLLEFLAKCHVSTLIVSTTDLQNGSCLEYCPSLGRSGCHGVRDCGTVAVVQAFNDKLSASRCQVNVSKA